MFFSVPPAGLEKNSNDVLDFWNVSKIFLHFSKLVMWMVLMGSQQAVNCWLQTPLLKGRNTWGPPASLHKLSEGSQTQQH